MTAQQTPPGQPSVRPYVPWGGRVLAYLADCVVPAALLGIGALLARPQEQLEERHGEVVTVVTGYGLLFYVAWLLGIAFFLWNKGYREGRTGQSLGKSLLRQTTLRKSTGKPLGVGRAVLRWILLCVDFAICYIGVLWPLWDQEKRCLLSDRITGAVVVASD